MTMFIHSLSHPSRLVAVLTEVTTSQCFEMKSALITLINSLLVGRYSYLAQPGVLDPGATKFFIVTVLTGEGLGGSLAKEVLVVVLTSGVLGPVLTSRWVHGGLDEDDDH